MHYCNLFHCDALNALILLSNNIFFFRWKSGSKTNATSAKNNHKKVDAESTHHPTNGLPSSNTNINAKFPYSFNRLHVRPIVTALHPQWILIRPYRTVIRAGTSQKAIQRLHHITTIMSTLRHPITNGLATNKEDYEDTKWWCRKNSDCRMRTKLMRAHEKI